MFGKVVIVICVRQRSGGEEFLSGQIHHARPVQAASLIRHEHGWNSALDRSMINASYRFIVNGYFTLLQRLTPTRDWASNKLESRNCCY